MSNATTTPDAAAARRLAGEIAAKDFSAAFSAQFTAQLARGAAGPRDPVELAAAILERLPDGYRVDDEFFDRDVLLAATLVCMTLAECHRRLEAES